MMRIAKQGTRILCCIFSCRMISVLLILSLSMCLASLLLLGCWGCVGQSLSPVPYLGILLKLHDGGWLPGLEPEEPITPDGPVQFSAGEDGGYPERILYVIRKETEPQNTYSYLVSIPGKNSRLRIVKAWRTYETTGIREDLMPEGVYLEYNGRDSRYIKEQKEDP